MVENNTPQPELVLIPSHLENHVVDSGLVDLNLTSRADEHQINRAVQQLNEQEGVDRTRSEWYRERITQLLLGGELRGTLVDDALHLTTEDVRENLKLEGDQLTVKAVSFLNQLRQELQNTSGTYALGGFGTVEALQKSLKTPDNLDKVLRQINIGLKETAMVLKNLRLLAAASPEIIALFQRTTGQDLKYLMAFQKLQKDDRLSDEEREQQLREIPRTLGMKVLESADFLTYMLKVMIDNMHAWEEHFDLVTNYLVRNELVTPEFVNEKRRAYFYAKFPEGEGFNPVAWADVVLADFRQALAGGKE